MFFFGLWPKEGMIWLDSLLEKLFTGWQYNHKLSFPPSPRLFFKQDFIPTLYGLWQTGIWGGGGINALPCNNETVYTNAGKRIIHGLVRCVAGMVIERVQSRVKALDSIKLVRYFELKI